MHDGQRLVPRWNFKLRRCRYVAALTGRHPSCCARRKTFDAMDDWPVQYGWWLKHRERSMEQIRTGEAAARQT